MKKVTGHRLRFSGNRAFTLLEVVISMLLLGIGLLGLMALQIRAVRSNSFSNFLSVASCVARNQVETLRIASATGWDSVTDGTYTDTAVDTDPDTGASRMVFTLQWVIQTDPSGRRRNVSVTVSWTQEGVPHQTTVNTVIAKRQ